MGIFDLFSNDASEDAYKNNTYAIMQGQNQGRDALKTGFQKAAGYINQGVNALGQGVGQARGDITGGYNAQTAALRGGYGDARNALAGGYQDQRADLTRVINSYNPLLKAGAGVSDAYYDAIGANGKAGSTQAQNNFQAGPGYQFQMDQSLDAVMRAAAARGSLAGGNTDVDLMKVGSGLADQEWDDYIANLGAGTDRYKGALDSQGNALTNRGTAANAYGTNQAGLYTQEANALGNAAGAYGTNMGNAALAGATGAANLYGQGVGASNTFGTNAANLALGGMNATTANNNALAQSENQQSQNLWGLGLNLATLGLSPMGGAAGTTAAGTAAAAGQTYNPFQNTLIGQGYNAMKPMWS